MTSRAAADKQHIRGRASWDEAWIQTFEQSSSFNDEVLRAGSRLERSQSFSDLEVAPGLISGQIQQRGSSYTAQLGIGVLDPVAWQGFVERLVGRPSTAVALLVGELPMELADSEVSGVALLPKASELYPDCNCGDWNGLCGHAAALLYQTANLISADPFVLTTLRGKGRYELKSMLESCRTSAADSSPIAISGQPRGVDQGVPAAAAYRRAVAALPSPRRLPLGVAEPLAVTVPPPVDSGVQSEDIHALVQAASERAWRLLCREW